MFRKCLKIRALVNVRTEISYSGPADSGHVFPITILYKFLDLTVCHYTFKKLGQIANLQSNYLSNCISAFLNNSS